MDSLPDGRDKVVLDFNKGVTDFPRVSVAP